MNSGDYTYIGQASNWPNWYYDLATLAGPLTEVSRAQGMLLGRLADVGIALREQASLAALTQDRLFGWHAALFPTGYSGLAPVRVGVFRNDANGPMQVVSGPVGRQRVHFEAPLLRGSMPKWRALRVEPFFLPLRMRLLLTDPNSGKRRQNRTGLT